MSREQFFRNVKQVTSPTSQNNSLTYRFQSHQSLVYNQQSNLQPTKLDFRSSNVSELENRFSNINMIRSQVVPDNDRGFTSASGFYSGGYNSNSNFAVNQYGNFQSSKVTDPLKESTMSYVRAIYKIIPNLSEDRIRQISENFVRLFGTEKQITTNGVKNIYRSAYQTNSSSQSLEDEQIKGLFKVLDFNHDQRITVEDIIPLCRRYLNFEKKQIVYTPMVEERLAVARRLFKQFDVERKGYLTQKQVPNLLNETYKCLGKTFTATEEDIKSWMKLTDKDNDGHVTLREYQESIIRALKKQGVKIYNEQE